MKKKGYIITCAGCGTENHRYNLPEKCLCSECGEMYYVNEYRILGDTET